jgi:hypothetical protein
METKQKPELMLAKADKLDPNATASLFVRLVGRKATPEKIEAARKQIADKHRKSGNR